MATATIRPLPLPFSNRIVPVNAAPRDFDPEGDLPEGFLAFLAPLHAAITLRQRALVARRENTLAEAHAGKLPSYVPPSVATMSSWKIELPAWCADQRNQMTGPADDAELVVKMVNSGAPGVMLDLEDSTRSEEHTSELQSRLHLVCRLLLEKKKKNITANSLPPSQNTSININHTHLHKVHDNLLPSTVPPRPTIHHPNSSLIAAAILRITNT